MSKDVESSVNAGRLPKMQSENSEEELSVLPRNTKVVVTGNNRTKSVLVGLHGVVKKAVGLGGWHWLELANRVEVKLQRNALSVIELPRAHEEDDDLDPEDIKWAKPDTAPRSHRRRHQTHEASGSQPKTMEKLPSGDSKDSVSALHRPTKVDLSKLDDLSLWRYWRHYNLADSSSNPNPTREQLLDVVQRHFASEKVDEAQVIGDFVRKVKTEKDSKWTGEMIKKEKKRNHK